MHQSETFIATKTAVKPLTRFAFQRKQKARWFMRTSKTSNFFFGELYKSFFYSKLMLLILKESKGDFHKITYVSHLFFGSMPNEVHVYVSDITTSEKWF